MNPAELPDPLDGTGQYGPLRTVLFFVLYAALVVGAIVYLRWKLSGVRGAGGERQDGPNDD